MKQEVEGEKVELFSLSFSVSMCEHSKTIGGHEKGKIRTKSED